MPALKEKPVLRGPRVLLRAPTPDDVDALAAALAAPEVSKYWPGFDRAKVQAELIDAEDPVVFAIEHEGEVIGAVQYGEEDDPMYRHARVDIFLAPRAHGRGLASEALRVLLAYLFDALGHHRAVIDPAADNARAIETYTRLGFRSVGVMRQYERGADGAWHDGVLMELLAGELRRA
jgi:aminoglycoside 6'-N-acetyltransferase